MSDVADELALFDPLRWGLPAEAVLDLANRLQRTWERYHDCFTTKTRDTSAYGLSYLRGLLTMETDRNYANIARRVLAPDADRQNLQQFMSDSPWSSAAVFQRIQAEIRARPDLHAGMLTLSESADERAGEMSAAAARQYLGRFGKVDLGQVGVALGYTHAGS